MATVLQVQPGSYGTAEGFVDAQFARQPTDLTIDGTVYRKYLPVNSIGRMGQTNVNFFVTRWVGRQFMDWGGVKLGAEIELLSADGAPFKDGTQVANSNFVAPINNVLQSVISEQNVFFNNVQLTTDGTNHWLKRFVEAKTGHSRNYKKSALEAQGWYDDTMGREDNHGNEHPGDNKANKGFYDRMGRFCTVDPTMEATSHWHPAWFWGHLESDYDRDVPNGIDVRVEIVLQKPELFLQALDNDDSKYQYRVNHMVLLVPVKTMASEPMKHIEARLKREPLRYNYRRSTITVFPMAIGPKKFISENLFVSRLLIPSRLFIMVVPEDSYLGDRHSTPYKFDRELDSAATITCMRLTRDGDSVNGLDLESQPVLDFTSFYDVLGQTRTGDTCSISLEQYTRGTEPAPCPRCPGPGSSVAPDTQLPFSLPPQVAT